MLGRTIVGGVSIATVAPVSAAISSAANCINAGSST
jgi:hypothetical protein